MQLSKKFAVGDVDNFFKIRQLDRYMIGHKGYIAGGVFKNILTNTKFKDVDVFFERKEDFEQAWQHFSKNEDFIVKYENDKVRAFLDKKNGVTVELIKHLFKNPVELLKDFDFTVTQFAYYKEEKDDESMEWKIIYHNQFFEHLFMKRLVIDKEVNEIRYPIGTFNRMFKYGRYGYNPCRETKIKIIQAIRRLPLFNEDQIDNDLYHSGVD